MRRTKSICQASLQSRRSTKAATEKNWIGDAPQTEKTGGSTNTVKSLNVYTNFTSTLRLDKLQEKPTPSSSRYWQLPKTATDGLRETILSTNLEPKMLQNEADQLFEKLSQRRFPLPSELVRTIRGQLRRSLQSKIADERVSGEELEAINEEKNVRKKIEKILKLSEVDWEPLRIQDDKAALVYAMARILPNFAEISQVLSEFTRLPTFCPETVLDYGCGTGSAFWALNEKFGAGVKEYTLIDSSPSMTNIAMDIMRNDEAGNSNGLIHPNINFRRNLLPSLNTKYDMVITHRTLIEIGSREARIELLTQLWNRANRFLIIIDDAKRDAFNAIIEARDYIISEGQKIHLNDTIKLLKEHNKLDEELEEILYDEGLSEYERWTILYEKLPNDMAPLTRLATGTVFAPCPHDLGCPVKDIGTCPLKARWGLLRADHRQKSVNSDGNASSSISYVILEKGAREGFKNPQARIMSNIAASGHSTCTVCTAYDGIQRFTLSKKHGPYYKALRLRNAGELLPFSSKKIASEDPILSVFDF